MMFACPASKNTCLHDTLHPAAISHASIARYLKPKISKLSLLITADVPKKNLLTRNHSHKFSFIYSVCVTFLD
jgi:hypothetical protein